MKKRETYCSNSCQDILAPFSVQNILSGLTKADMDGVSYFIFLISDP